MIGVTIVIVTLFTGLIAWFFTRSTKDDITREEFQYQRLTKYITADEELLKGFISDKLEWLEQTEDIQRIVFEFNNRN